ncbi:hypothetical protein [Kibdelosporangium aridum]|uniref:hypothetical protein n=1 Tax=Kibdelosporangium aridum TaxID=2030 RepID=UPI00068EE92D
MAAAGQYRGGVHHIARIRLLCGDIARVHGAVQAANSTMDAPSDLALNLVFTGGTIGNYTASYPEIPVPPEPNDMRLYGTEGVLVPLWRPCGSNGLPGQRISSSASFAA